MKSKGGVNIVQSYTIARYLARKHGFNGNNEQEAAMIDCVFEGAIDLGTAFYSVKLAPLPDESQRPTLIRKFLDDAAPKHLAHFQNLLQRNHGGSGKYLSVFFFVPSSLIASFSFLY